MQFCILCLEVAVMKEKKISRIWLSLLSLFLVMTVFPFEGLSKDVYAESSIVDFTDAENRGAWAKTNGNGEISFVDGIGSEGYMELASNDNTIFADTESLVLTDGYVEMDITRVKNARFGIIFRYQDANNWEGIGVDSGTWYHFLGSGGYGKLTSSKSSFTTNGETHHMRIEFRGKNIRVLEDGVEIIKQDVSAFGKIEKGTVGFRLWGVLGDYQCKLNIDNVETGTLKNEITVTPTNFTIPYEEMGSKDIHMELSTDNAQLSEVRNGATSLIENQDFVVEGTKLSIKSDYLQSIKEVEHTTLSLVFSDEQTVDINLYVEKSEDVIQYTQDFESGIDSMEKVSGTGTMLAESGKLVVEGKGVFVDQNSESLKNQEVEFLFDPTSNTCNYGVVLRYNSLDDYVYVGPASQKSQNNTTWGIYGPSGQIATIPDSGFVLEGRSVPYKVKVRVEGQVVTIFMDNEEIYNGTVSITQKPGKVGFATSAGTGMKIESFTQRTVPKFEIKEAIQLEKIESEQMVVTLDKKFPRIVSYALSSGEIVQGQEQALHVVELNNTLYAPIVSLTTSGDTAIYHMYISELDVSFEVEVKVSNQVVSYTIMNVVEPTGYTLYTINFPRHSLISMTNKDTNAELRANNYQDDEVKKALTSMVSSESYQETTLAVLSNATVAAALSGSSYKNRHEIAYQTFSLGEYTSTGIWMNEFSYRGLDGERIEHQDRLGNTTLDPWVNISITTDRNLDGKVDFQDAAIALRDDCMIQKVGADVATSSWNMIAMNVGSEAQYPFLRILDNAKKVSLATDDFKQNIYIKGYQSEGHDAAHPDFDNYNKRAGGLTDFNTLLKQAASANTTVGIHINHTDVYPESAQYAKLKTAMSAWSWYDSSAQIIRENDGLDKSEQGFDARLERLYDIDTNGDIASTYVDVFFGTRWPMYKLVQNINGKDRKMGLGTEYVDEFVGSSVFAHHINSRYNTDGNLVRFVNHNQADMFGNSSLFRGASSRSNDDVGINGWQTAKNLNTALDAFYTRILPNKFLAQYPLMKYETSTSAILGEHMEVETKMVGSVNVITKDGYEVARGNTIFIPWESDSKVYHYNQSGGTTTWRLPLSWGDISEVTLYELSDEGKKNPVKITVNDNQVTLTAKAKQGYVLYQEDAVEIKTAETTQWSTGSLVKDMGFDSHTLAYWEASSTANTVDHIYVKNNTLGNSHLFMEGKADGQVKQTLEGLEVGSRYAASVWVITDTDRKAEIVIQNGKDKIVAYTNKSDVEYGIHHSDKYKTYAQRMIVEFVATNTTVDLVLAAEAGDKESSLVDFDDVRLVKIKQSTNPDAKKYKYWTDFENVDQGFGLFVSTESDQSHLSQRNPINPEYTPDVIDGEYSLKIRKGDYVRTIPANVRLEPNKQYTVGITYKSAVKNAFTFAVKSDKAKTASDVENTEVASVLAPSTEGVMELTFTTGDYDDYYIDITKSAATEYYLDNFYVIEAKPITLDSLKELIEEAKGFESEYYTSESFHNLQDKIQAAQAIVDQTPTIEQVETAYEALETAIKDLEAYATLADKKVLADKITELSALNPEDYKQDEKWVALQALLEVATTMNETGFPTKKEVIEMIDLLNEARNQLHPFVDRTNLNAIIVKAEKVDRGVVVDGKDLQTFLSTLEDAKELNNKAGVTATEIEEMATRLSDCYAVIILKEDDKNEMVELLYGKTKVKEEYFFEEDYATIKALATKLLDMKQKTKVTVKEYYEIYEQLQEALDKKLSRPIIDRAYPIDQSLYIATANTEQGNYESLGEGPIRFAFDNNPATFWHSKYSGFVVSSSNPAIVEIDLQKEYPVNQFAYLQRPAGGNNGKIQKYNLYLKQETGDWEKVVTLGTFQDVNELQKVQFDVMNARYIKLEIVQAYGNFASAAEFIVYQNIADFASLIQVLDTYDSLDLSLYSQASVAELKTVVEAAVVLLEDVTNVSQEDIDVTVLNIKDKIQNLVRLANRIDILSLRNVVASAQLINVEQYEDVESFVNARAYAVQLLSIIDTKEREVTQAEVVNTITTLMEEQGKLQKIAIDKSGLAAAIARGNELVKKEDVYTAMSLKLYQIVLQQAIVVYEQTDVLQSEVDTAVKNLVDAETLLVEIEHSLVDKSTLQSLYDTYSQKTSDRYTESWKPFETALTKTLALLQAEDATQSQIDAMCVELKKAHENLITRLQSLDGEVIVEAKLKDEITLNVDIVDHEGLKAKLSADDQKQINFEKAYDIQLLENEELHNFQGEATVKIALHEETRNKEGLGVVFVDEAGVVTRHVATIENGYLVFKTDHFSTYAIVSKASETSKEEDKTSIEKKPATQSPKAGDTSGGMGFAMLCLASFVLISRKFRKLK